MGSWCGSCRESGSKWVIEAPYVLEAAIQHNVNLGWVVQIYNAAEALPNLLNPFWMLPLLGMLRIKARDLVGYSMLQMLMHIPLVFFLCWLFARIVPFIARACPPVTTEWRNTSFPTSTSAVKA